MKFGKSLYIILASVKVLLINADKVSFKVLAINGTPFVTVNGQQYEMTLEEYPLYKAKVEVDKFPVEYNYNIVYADGSSEQESFSRKREKEEKSLNEFFNRSQTVIEHPQVPKAYQPFEFYEPSKLYDDTHVSTIIINVDNQLLQQMYQNPTDQELKANAVVVYASPYSVKTFNNAILSISGQSTRGVPKLSYKLKNLKSDDNKELFNRSSIKLRAEHMDPSFLRDKIYGDILNSLGVPAAQNKFARVFINGQPVGLFDLSDDITSGRYLRETFNKGEKYTQENPIFKADYCPSCGIGAVYSDLGYYGEDINEPMYAVYSYKGDDNTTPSMTHVANEIIPLVREINAYANYQTETMSFDIDTFLKYMAVEFLAGAIDNYWNKPGNYFLYKDVAKGKWYFHDADFHFSFGVGGEPDLMINTPLSDYPPIHDPKVDKARPPLDAILSRPENKARFTQIFDRLLKTSFHTGSLYSRIDSFVELIYEDAQWDYSIPRVSQLVGQHDTELNYNFDDFLTHVTSTQEVSRFETVPLKYFIRNKIALVSQELGIQVPEQYETDLGMVENPSQKASVSSFSGTSRSLSMVVFSSFMAMFISYILF
ncbi:coth-domain-containing protein [Piromyces finnis]|uniref:Coth-domain-containing protein n=1 Tax=Piromyces finnis TaxID=1754191 RepID=A0A1Y1VGE5_9FUNG|nr:coth-domain-containing protein [Piromyces finnis]|eukprot:ORX55497.1 coth-domain-containing protein [Piromyces finnis]